VRVCGKSCFVDLLVGKVEAVGGVDRPARGHQTASKGVISTEDSPATASPDRLAWQAPGGRNSLRATASSFSALQSKVSGACGFCQHRSEGNQSCPLASQLTHKSPIKRYGPNARACLNASSGGGNHALSGRGPPASAPPALQAGYISSASKHDALGVPQPAQDRRRTGCALHNAGTHRDG
jgi:hypothetical protein